MFMVKFGSFVVPLLLFEVFTVMEMLKVSVQMFHLMASPMLLYSKTILTS